ncbi:hypothetical protein FS837_002767 [Tulasnella sp. UAMH 9824]|nr:hypothetical protein FS837_002767 [Tulasnella sp. UAMH 9824]
MPDKIASLVSWPKTMSMSYSATVMTASGAQAPPCKQPTADPRIRPGSTPSDPHTKPNKEVGPQQITLPHLHVLQLTQNDVPLRLAQQNRLQTRNQDQSAHPEILNHSQAGESQSVGASEGRDVPPCPPGAHPLAVGVGVVAQPPSDEVVRSLNDELSAERARARKLESRLALLSDERDSLVAERGAARAERDAMITINMGLEAQILAVEKLLKGLESCALAGLGETVTLCHTP